MIAHSPNSFCKEAQIYYYDFIFNESRKLIPQPIVDHIEQCQYCKERISKLKAVLSQAQGIEPQHEQGSSAVATMLKLHFAYSGKPVTCNIVKPFLPTLLDQALEVRIPTPIIIHICNCRQCSEDLATIRGLKLHRKQLCQLSQLFADEPLRTNVSFSEAQKAIHAVVSMDFNGTDSEVLKHLCKCPVCRDLLYRQRQKLCESIPEHATPLGFPCGSVSASDIFDYVMPYGLDPGSDQYAKFRKSFTSHTVSCPNCLAKMQTLHNTIYSIAERPDSEVVTIYNIDESFQTQAVKSDELYAGFPIRVEKAHRDGGKVDTERPANIIDFGAILKRKVSATNLKLLVKPAIAAAAVILIAVALFFNVPAAKAVTIDQIYRAIEKVKNIYIESFVADNREPVQEIWVSRTLNNYMTKTGKETVLWDLQNKIKKVRYLGSDSTTTTSMSDDIIAEIEKNITGSMGLLPFPDISKIPKNVEWERVTGNGLKAKGAEVYDLSWVELIHSEASIFKKCRLFINPNTNLPHKIEIYRKSLTDSEYKLRSAAVVEYLSDSEMQDIIKENSF
jgi:hypothetical protein